MAKTYRFHNGQIEYMGENTQSYDTISFPGKVYAPYSLDGTNLATPTGRTSGYIVAAYNSSFNERSQADKVLSGTSDETDINALIASGKVIYFASGTYNLTATISVSGITGLTLKSDGLAKFVVTGGVEAFTIADSNDIIIQRLDISTDDSTASYTRSGVVKITGSTDIKFKDNVVHDVYMGMWIVCNTTTHAKTSRVEIANNEFYYCNYLAINLSSGVEYINIHDNFIHDITPGDGANLYGIAGSFPGLEDTTSPMQEWVIIHHNTITDLTSGTGSLGKAIDIHGMNHCIVTDNQIKNVNSTAINIHCYNYDSGGDVFEDWRVSGNIIDGCITGIGVTNNNLNAKVKGVQVNDNIITNWSDAGISVRVTDDADISMSEVGVVGNQISEHTGSVAGSCIYILGASPTNLLTAGLVVANNSVSGQNLAYNGGTQVHAGYGIYVRYWSDYLITGNNINYCNPSAISITSGGLRQMVTNNNIVLFRNGIYGIWFVFGVDPVITGNVIREIDDPSGVIGINVSNSSVTRPVVKNNSIYNCETPISYANAIKPVYIEGNLGFVSPGEIRTYSGTITGTASNNGAIMLSVANPFSQAVRALETNISITAQSSTASTLDAGIGASATTDYSTMIAALPLNPGTTYPYYYTSSNTTTYGVRPAPINWPSTSYLNFFNPSANATGTTCAISYVVTIMGN
jgi:Right handed beta helix region